MFSQKKAPLVSIIILNFNGAAYLERCISSVLGTNYPNFEVIFIDNASTDSSLKLVEKNFGNDDRLRVFRSNQNLGFSGGNVLGFGHSRGQYVAFLNNDTIADPCWLAALVNTMEKDKTIGIACSSILGIDGEKVRGTGWLCSSYLLFFCPVGTGKRCAEFIPTIELSFATGCSMIARKDFLNEIGLFDPEIPYNYDDTLLSLKTWLAGKRVVSVSGSKVRHFSGATVKKFWNDQLLAFSHSRAKMCLLFDVYFKFKDLSKAVLILNFSVAIDSIFSIRRKNLSELIGKIHASAWIIKNFRHVWMNRLQHWNNPKISPELLIEKFIRIKLRFPLCVVPSTVRNLIYRDEYLRYEDKIIQKLR